MTATMTPPVELRVRPQIVITLPSFRRRKTKNVPLDVAPEANTFTRMRRRVRLALHSVANLFTRVAKKLWNISAIKVFACFVAAVAVFGMANLIISVIAILLALPFYLVGWMFIGDIVFLSTLILGWWAVTYYTIGAFYEKL